jgi:hypothetical protein
MAGDLEQHFKGTLLLLGLETLVQGTAGNKEPLFLD